MGLEHQYKEDLLMEARRGGGGEAVSHHGSSLFHRFYECSKIWCLMTQKFNPGINFKVSSGYYYIEVLKHHSLKSDLEASKRFFCNFK